ncbi:Rpn family recombination-promoting nuclease/putative transposase [Serratia fonticola]
MLQMGSTTKPERLLRELARRAPQHEEELMTIAEYLEQKGFDKGIEKGIEEGRKEGREAILKIALSMLAKGFDHAMVIQLTGLSEEDLAKIHH